MAIVGMVVIGITFVVCMYILDYRESCGIGLNEDPIWEMIWTLMICYATGAVSMTITSSIIDKYGKNS